MLIVAQRCTKCHRNVCLHIVQTANFVFWGFHYAHAREAAVALGLRTPEQPGAPAALSPSVWGSGLAGEGVAATETCGLLVAKRSPQRVSTELVCTSSLQGWQGNFWRVWAGGSWSTGNFQVWAGGYSWCTGRGLLGAGKPPGRASTSCSGPGGAGKRSPFLCAAQGALPASPPALCVCVRAEEMIHTQVQPEGGRCQSRQPEGSRSPEEETGVGVGTGDETDTGRNAFHT